MASITTSISRNEYSSFPPDWSVGVLYAGSERCAPGHSWQGVRDHVVLHVIERGSGTFRSAKTALQLAAGDVFMIHPSHFVHYTASKHSPWEYRWIGFGGLHALEMVERIGFSRQNLTMHLGEPRAAVRAAEGCESALSTRSPASQLQAIGFLYQLLSIIQNTSRGREKTRTAAAELVGEAQSFMRQNYQREIGVLDVIKHIGVDRSHFSRVFKEATGGSLQESLIQIRMEKALRLLKESGLSVRAVAGSVGYESYHSFERRFRRYFGMSPSAARSQEAPASSRSPRPESLARRESESRP